ncbi:hypothetical protein TKK_0014717 [Trichogramma kaykai]
MYNFAIYSSFKVSLNKTVAIKKKEGTPKEMITAIKENATSDFSELIIAMECTDWCRYDLLSRAFSEELQPIFCHNHCDNCERNDDARDIEFPMAYEKIHNFVRAHANMDHNPMLNEAVTHLAAYGLYNAPHGLCVNDSYDCLITLPKRWISRLELNAIAAGISDYEIMDNVADDDFSGHLVLKPKMYFEELIPVKLPIRDMDQIEYKSKKHYIMELTRRALWRLFMRYSGNQEALSVYRIMYAYNDIVKLQPLSDPNHSVFEQLHLCKYKLKTTKFYININQDNLAMYSPDPDLDANIIKLQLQELSCGISDTSMVSVGGGRRSFKADLTPKYLRMFADIDACDNYAEVQATRSEHDNLFIKLYRHFTAIDAAIEQYDMQSHKTKLSHNDRLLILRFIAFLKPSPDLIIRILDHLRGRPKFRTHTAHVLQTVIYNLHKHKKVADRLTDDEICYYRNNNFL